MFRERRHIDMGGKRKLTRQEILQMAEKQREQRECDRLELQAATKIQVR